MNAVQGAAIRGAAPSPILRIGLLNADRRLLLPAPAESGLEVMELDAGAVLSGAADGVVLGWRGGAADLARRVRCGGYAGPLIAALRQPSTEEVVTALSFGCDDAQPFPCAPGELSARIAAIRRRIARSDARPGLVRAGRLEIGHDGSDPRIDGKPLKVSPNCAKVLAIVAGSRHPVPLPRIATALYGPDPPPSKTVNTYLCMLRSIMATATGTDGWLKLTDRGYVLFDAEG